MRVAAGRAVLALGLIAPGRVPAQPAPTTPPSGDTVGYWQQRADYSVVARLDERASTLHATGTLVYVNHSPDTLRELYFHQYLNAFRPHSAWSAVDEHEGRVRFQRLRDPDYGYERFVGLPTVNGAPVTPEYPGAPDSTVVRFRLPHPLRPRDSCTVAFGWDARPSTMPRRQGRRARSYDFAQWYPKVAVYDRIGWEAHPLTPAGELYGEFGTFDVTLIVRPDQIVGSSGTVVAGDPGWVRVSETPNYPRPSRLPPAPLPSVEPGWKAIRFIAHNVHHFAWSTSPLYRYEGGEYVATTRPEDTIAIHVLYRPGDERTWGHGVAVRRTANALAWLESVYGVYAYPQLTNLHRIEGGGTEFPMMIMDGSASQGLILHEAGHMYTYAILANNEWASAWMDEGLTSYQTEWAERLTRADRHRPAVGPQVAIADEGIVPPPPRGYRALAVTPNYGERGDIAQYRLDLLHHDQPIGLAANRFREFGIYNEMVYNRAVRMYGALRDVLGPAAWERFLHGYYARWTFKHVDELAMRTEAERAAGRDLQWFFDEWLRRTGVVEYALGDWTTAPADKGWLTTVVVLRRGRYRHPIPVGVRTADGWTVVRSEPLRDPDTVRVRTRLAPRGVRLDPQFQTEDWWRPDDADVTVPWIDRRTSRLTIDWPLLDQWREGQIVAAFLPYAWYSDPGHLTPALRLRANYQGWLDRIEIGVAMPTGANVAGRSRLQAWVGLGNPVFGAQPEPGLSIATWALDGVDKVELRRTWDMSPFVYANGPQRTVSVALTGTYPYDSQFYDPARWEGNSATSLSVTGSIRTPAPDTIRIRGSVDVGIVDGKHVARGYIRADAAVTRAWATSGGGTLAAVRAYAAYGAQAPIERAVFLTSLDATETFSDDYLRPLGSPLARRDVHFVARGGAGLRGYDSRLAVPQVAAVNADVAQRVIALADSPRALGAYLGAFADAATTFQGGGLPNAPLPSPKAARTMAAHILADAGVGVAIRGYVYDRNVALRVDVPFFVAQPSLAAGATGGGADIHPAAWRWSLSFNDLW